MSAWWDSLGDGPRAVLREVDQRGDRSPTACVKTGQPTERATRATATGFAHAIAWQAVVGDALVVLAARLLRRPTCPVVLAVSEGAWRRWRSRLGRAVLVLGAGLAALALGVLQGDGGLEVLGALVLLLGWWLRHRAWMQSWVGLVLRPDAGDIIVTRVHQGFSDDARRIYVASIQRRP